jgi:hypothetical protein
VRFPSPAPAVLVGCLVVAIAPAAACGTLLGDATPLPAAEDGGLDDGHAIDACPVTTCDGMCQPTPIVEGRDTPYLIVADPAPCGRGALFWTEKREDAGTNHALVTASKDGLRAHDIAAATAMLDLTRSATHVAWAGFSEVGVAPFDGGLPRVVASAIGAYNVALFEGTLFWGNRYGVGIGYHGIDDVPCTSNACRGFATGSYSLDVTADSTGLYWSELGPPDDAGVAGGDGALRASALDGSNVRTLVSPTLATKLTLGPDRLYYIADYRGHALSQTGQSLALAADDPRDFAIWDGRLYWTSGRGEIRSSALDGSNVAILTPAAVEPQGIAVDDVAVYWTEPTRGRIMRLAR